MIEPATDKTSAEEDFLTEAKKVFKRAQEAEDDNRKAWLEDWKFARVPGHQWPEAVRNMREIEGRPCLTINRLPAFIKQVTNNARLNKPAIKTHPVGDGADQETSEIFNGLIRNIEVTSNAEIAYDTALDHAVTGGFGYLRVEADYAYEDVFDKDLLIKPVENPLTVYGDPDCLESDSCNWNVAFVTDMYRREEFEAQWPDAETTSWTADGDLKDSEWFRDDEIRVAEYWKRIEVSKTIYLMSNGAIMDEDGLQAAKELLEAQGVTVKAQRETRSYKVTQYLITGAEVLETNEWAGKYIPIVPVYGDEVIIEGKRHLVSLIREAKDSQRMVNYWKTTATEMVALQPKAPFVGPKGSFVSDAAKWGTANGTNHAYIEYDPVVGDDGQAMPPPQRQPMAGVPAGAIQEALSSGDDMKSIMGLFDASLGARSNETSGIAINQRKQQGDISTFNFLDNQARAIRHLGRILVDMIPRVYNTARIIRVLNEDGTNESVPINGMTPPGQQGQPPQQPPAPMPVPMGPQGPMPMQGGTPVPGMPAQDEDARTDAQGLARVFDLTVGKYDVTVDTGPSFQTKREESAEQMSGLIQKAPNLMPLIGDLLVKNMDWPGADEIAKRLHTMLPPQLLGQDPKVAMVQKQMGAQLQQMDAHAKQAVQTLQGMLQQQGQKAGGVIQKLQDQLKQYEQDIQTLQLQLTGAKADKQLDVAKLHVDAYGKETDRLKVMGTTLDPASVQAIAQQTTMDVLSAPPPGREMGADGKLVPTPEEMMEQQQQAAAQQAQQEQAAQMQQMLMGLAQGMQSIMGGIQQLAQLSGAERELIRDPAGRPIGSRPKLPAPPEQPPQGAQQPQQPQAPQGAF